MGYPYPNFAYVLFWGPTSVARPSTGWHFEICCMLTAEHDISLAAAPPALVPVE